jgi:nitroimidazol reductase NimA-like FMN-containing flavoprotein (pyridoxamine 5'-phosphate oxidase superfamily)
MTRKKANERKINPQASRPHIPDYGIPKDNKGMLPWSYVSQRMAEALHYWVGTVDENGRPHATPVDGIWLDDRLYFGGSTKTRRHRNLMANPAVCIHLESGTEVVILHGEAREFHAPNHEFAVLLAEASKKKYGYAPPPEMYETAEGVFRFHPQMALAWKQFPKDATRWHFETED